MITDHGHQATPGRPGTAPEQIYIELARAKVNLTLRILGKRLDGYHELESLVAFADEADVLTLDLRRPMGLTVTGPMAVALNEGHDNLVAQAMALAMAEAPGLAIGHITLEKHLPVAAGIGGGSANAAATLRLLRRANPSLSIDVVRLATRLGADVAVCLANVAATMTGIGEQVAPLGRMLDLPAVMVNPMVAVPANKTAAVFKALSAAPVGAKRSELIIWPLDILTSIAASGNDLEPPATQVMPVIADVLAALRALPGSRLARVSGAGPSCFALFDTLESANAAKSALASSRQQWWIRATRLT